MKKSHAFLFAAMALLLAALACTLPVLQGAVPPTIGPSPVFALPSTTATRKLAPQVQQATPTQAPPSPTPTVRRSPSGTPTLSSERVMIRATRNTNCRTGPGKEFDLVYILLAGAEAEVVARSSVPNYAIINVPESSGRECWLWMRYTRLAGSIDALPVRTPPPTATTPPTKTPTTTPTETHLPAATATAANTPTP